MTKQVLQTRMVGYATDRTGHVMAKPEIVYEVDHPRPPPTYRSMRMYSRAYRTSWKRKLWMIAGILCIATPPVQFIYVFFFR